MRDTCQREFVDPDEMGRHLAECEVCRSKEEAFARAEQSVAPPARSDRLHEEVMTRLPVAPWEGARHRAWSVVLVAAALILVALFAISSMAGLSSVDAMGAGLDAIPTLDVITTFAGALGELTGTADSSFHVAVGLGFILFNTLLLLLLRRRPRGYDA